MKTYNVTKLEVYTTDKCTVNASNVMGPKSWRSMEITINKAKPCKNDLAKTIVLESEKPFQVNVTKKGIIQIPEIDSKTMTVKVGKNKTTKTIMIENESYVSCVCFTTEETFNPYPFKRRPVDEREPLSTLFFDKINF